MIDTAGSFINSGLRYGAEATMSGLTNTANFMLLPPAPNPLAQAPGMNVAQYHAANSMQSHPWALQARAMTGMYGAAPTGVSQIQYQMALNQRAQLERNKYTVNLMQNADAPYQAANLVGFGAMGLSNAPIVGGMLSSIPGMAAAATMGKLAVADMGLSWLGKSAHRFAMSDSWSPTSAFESLFSSAMDPTHHLARKQAASFRRAGLDEFTESSFISGALRLGLNETLLRRPADFIQRTAFDDTMSKSAHMFTGFNPRAIGGRGFTQNQISDVYSELKNVARGSSDFKLDDVVTQFQSNLAGGQYSDVKDVPEFKRRVKEIKDQLKYLKEVGKVTGESAADLRNEMQRLKQELGVSGPDAFAAYKLGAAPMGMISGLGTTGVQQGGMFGAQSFRGAGFNASQGYITGQRLTTLAGMLQQQGPMSSQQWEGIGGAQGFAASLIQNTTQALSSSIGSTVVAGLASVGADGNLQIDQNKLAALRAGRMDYTDLVRQGSKLINQPGRGGEMQLRVLSQLRNLAQEMPAEEPLLFAVSAMEQQLYRSTPGLKGKTDAESRGAVALGVSQYMQSAGVDMNQHQAEAYLDLSRKRMDFTRQQQNLVQAQERRNARLDAELNMPGLGLARSLFKGRDHYTGSATGRREYIYSELGETESEYAARSSWLPTAAATAGAWMGGGSSLVGSLMSGSLTFGSLSGAAVAIGIKAIPITLAAAATYGAARYAVNRWQGHNDPDKIARDEIRQSQREAFLRQRAYEIQVGGAAYTHEAVERRGMLGQLVGLFKPGGPQSLLGADGERIVESSASSQFNTYVAPTWAEAQASGEIFTATTADWKNMAERNYVRDLGRVGVATAGVATAGAGAGAVLFGLAKATVAAKLLPLTIGAGLIWGGYKMYRSGRDDNPLFATGSREEAARNTAHMKNMRELLGEDEYRSRGFDGERDVELLKTGNLNDYYFGFGTETIKRNAMRKSAENIFLSAATDIGEVSDVFTTSSSALKDFFKTSTGDAFDVYSSGKVSRPTHGVGSGVLAPGRFGRRQAVSKLIGENMGDTATKVREELTGILGDTSLSSKEKSQRIAAVMSEGVVGDSLRSRSFSSIMSSGPVDAESAAGIRTLQNKAGIHNLTVEELAKLHGQVTVGLMKELGVDTRLLGAFELNQMEQVKAAAERVDAFFDSHAFKTNLIGDTIHAPSLELLNTVTSTIQDGAAGVVRSQGVEYFKDSNKMNAAIVYNREVMAYKAKVAKLRSEPDSKQRNTELRNLESDFKSKVSSGLKQLGIDADAIDLNKLNTVIQGDTGNIEKALTSTEDIQKYLLAESTYNVLGKGIGQARENLRQHFKVKEGVAGGAAQEQTDKFADVDDALAKFNKTVSSRGADGSGADTLFARIQSVVFNTHRAGGNEGLAALLQGFGVEDAENFIEEVATKGRGDPALISRKIMTKVVQVAQDVGQMQAEHEAAQGPGAKPMSGDLMESLDQAITGLQGVKNHFAKTTNRSSAVDSVSNAATNSVQQ